MAIAEMRKMLLIGSKDEKKQLLDILQKTSCVEIADAQEIENTGSCLDEKQVEEAKFKFSRLNVAFSLLNDLAAESARVCKENKIKFDKNARSMFNPKPSISFEEFSKLSQRESELFEIISQIEDLNLQLSENRTENVKNHNLINQLSVYSGLSVKFSKFKDTKNTAVMLGTIGNSKVSQIPSIKELFPDAIFETADGIKAVPFITICFKSDKNKILEKLSELEYTPCNFSFDKTAKECIEDLENDVKALDEQRKQIIVKIAEYNKYMEEFRLFHDYYTIELRKIEVDGQIGATRTAYLLEGWVPKSKEKDVEKLLNESKLILTYEFRDPIAGEVPPTLTVNNALVAPYETVTNMYSTPRYREVDPNKFVAFFFFLMVGMMISDAGYGFLLALSTGIILLRVKPQRHEMKIVKVLLMAGISTIIWGILFGSYFGITYKPLLFAPLDSPIQMLGLGLVIGLVQLLTGMGISAYRLFKEKKPFDAIFTVFPWYFLVIGLALFFLGGRSILGKDISVTFKAVGKWMLIGSLIGLAIGGTLHKKGIKKVSGGFGALYGIINLFSDVLSYSRLFGLGLATGVIAFVFNEIAMVLMRLIPILGYILGIAILLIGHIFNVAINTLGAYVHNARLQFIEFFAKFYDGEGRLFEPLGSENKYYRIN